MTLDAIPYSSVDGAILVPLHVWMPDCDTSGVGILDTGAGYLALDASLCGAAPTGAALAWATTRPDSIALGAAVLGRPEHALTLDLADMREVADASLLALLGQELWRDAALVLDPRSDTLRVVRGFSNATMPAPADSIAASREALGPALVRNAEPIRFTLAGDGKIVVRAALDRGPDTLTLIVDTGATKTAFFADHLAPSLPLLRRRSVAGLSAPTVMGAAPMRMVRTERIQLEQGAVHVEADQVDAALVGGPLGRLLSNAIGRTAHGLLGYSFLRRFRTIIDYPHRVLWLERIPVTRDARPYEYTTIGVQLRRSGGQVLVDGVVEGGPAARAGLRPGDEITAIDGTPVGERSLARLSEQFEGPDGTPVRVDWRGKAGRRTAAIVRRELL